MKKIILSAVAVMAFGFANAQDAQFKIGVHAGLPMGDIKDGYSVNLGVDGAYLWNVADQFKAGVTTGYTTYLGKTETIDLGGFGTMELKNEAIGFIPVAGTAQYSLTDNLFIGADLGYAILVQGEGDGGVLYQPKIGYQTEKIELYAGYKGISVEGATASSFNIGLNFKL